MEFTKVEVPVGHLLGEENQGFGYIVSNFNHERWMILVSANRFNRLVLEDCFKWAHQRKAFGQRLIDQPVSRPYLGDPQQIGPHGRQRRGPLKLDRVPHFPNVQSAPF